MHLEFLDFLLAGSLMLGAVLFTSVGHGGASAYIALMALFGLESTVIRPTALVLNVLVTSFSSIRYFRAGLLDWKTAWPVILGAVPLAYLGGAITLPGHFYRPLVGLVLVASAVRLLWPGVISRLPYLHQMPVLPGIVSGAGIGFLAGLTGTGGGIFLSPLLVFMGWSDVRKASGVTSLFILCNSLAGLAGAKTNFATLPTQIPLYVGAVMIGAIIGTYLGISALAKEGILKVLALVLLVASAKLFGLY